MRTILITRPEEETEPLARMLAAKGFKTLTEPLLHIEPLHENQSALEAALESAPEAILVTSKRAIAVAAEMSPERRIRVFPVGAATAHYAAALGYECAPPCETAKALAAHIGKHFTAAPRPRLLYLRGEDISTDIASELGAMGFTVDSLILYRAVALQKLSQEVQSAMAAAEVAGALFFSRRTAEIYARLMQLHTLQQPHRNMHAVCMSEAVAEPLRFLPWRSILIADKPDMQHMLQAAGKVF